MKTVTRTALAAVLDQALLNPQATRNDVMAFCVEARKQVFRAVAVHGSRVELAYSLLEDTNVKVAALVGFPFGAGDSDVKRYEAEVAIDQGAHEIEFVLNVGRLKEGDRASVLREMRDIAEAADERPVTACWNIGSLTTAEELLVCELAMDSGIQFAGMGTYMGTPASSADVQRIREALGPKFGLKVSAPLKDTLSVVEILEAGATRLGVTNGAAVLDGLIAT
jgi:deoxyribose-phosphate aldolase